MDIIEAVGHADPVTAETRASNAPPPTPIGRRGRGRGANSMTLKQAILNVTERAALGRKEIVEAVQKIGYEFTSKNSLNPIGSVIYGQNPKFKNEGGKHSPLGGTRGGRSRPKSRENVEGPTSIPRKGKRTISPEHKAKLAAAARRRWKKSTGSWKGAPLTRTDAQNSAHRPKLDNSRVRTDLAYLERDPPLQQNDLQVSRREQQQVRFAGSLRSGSPTLRFLGGLKGLGSL